jgi:16S rRNA (guanine527-N7)-methyltransferase
MNCGRRSLAELENFLKEGIRQLNIPLTPITLDRILLYVDYLAHWNQTYNLTAIKDKRDMIIKHVLDSLSLYPFLHGKRCIDVGTGPGLPGFMLALALPEIEFVLLDSQIKKTQFIRRVLREIPLDNVAVCHQRIEDHKPAILYDIIVSRAFASLQDMIQCTVHLRAPQSYYLAMKGIWPQPEIAAIEKDYSIEVKALNVPFLQGERHVVIIR